MNKEISNIIKSITKNKEINDLINLEGGISAIENESLLIQKTDDIYELYSTYEYADKLVGKSSVKGLSNFVVTLYNCDREQVKTLSIDLRCKSFIFLLNEGLNDVLAIIESTKQGYRSR